MTIIIITGKKTVLISMNLSIFHCSLKSPHTEAVTNKTVDSPFALFNVKSTRLNASLKKSFSFTFSFLGL